MYSLITSFFQGYYPKYTPLEPDYLTVSESQLRVTNSQPRVTNGSQNIDTDTTQDSLQIDIQPFEQTIDDTNYYEPNKANSRFFHLQFMRQNYVSHFKDTMRYSFMAFKASFYFFIHAIYPDICQHTGSDIVVEISDEIIQTYKECLDKLDAEIFDV